MNPRVLIGLEETASLLLKTAAEPAAKKLAQDAVNCKDPLDLFAKFDLRPHIEPHLAKFEEIAVSAAIFGAAQLVPAEQTMFTKGEGLDRVRKGAKLMARMVGDGATARIRKHGMEAFLANTPSERLAVLQKSLSIPCCPQHALGKQVLKAEAVTIKVKPDDEKPSTSKAKPIRVAADDMDISDALNAATLGNTRLVSDTAANLTTTRLAAYGFLAQAQKDGVRRYQINEILDERTCPVCAYMHGKTFEVGKALKQTEEALDADDPDDLEDIAPWPDQTKSGIEDLLSSDTDEMTEDGFMAPPFHPLCRGILAPVGTIENLIPTMTEGKASRLMGEKGWFDKINDLFMGKGGDDD